MPDQSRCIHTGCRLYIEDYRALFVGDLHALGDVYYFRLNTFRDFDTPYDERFHYFLAENIGYALVDTGNQKVGTLITHSFRQPTQDRRL